MKKITNIKMLFVILALIITSANYLAAGSNIMKLRDGVVSYSTAINSSSTGTNVFDRNPGTRWLTAKDNPTGFVQFQFTNNTSYVVKSYTIWTLSAHASSRSVKDFSLQGSNNGIDWTILDSQTDQTGWSDEESRDYSFDNDTAFSYFKFVITANNGSPYVGLNELELFETTDRSDLVVYESFEDLSIGKLNGQGTEGNGWTTSWNAKDQVAVANIALSYTGGEVKIDGGNKAMLITNINSYVTANREFDDIFEPVIYISALVKSKNIIDQNKMLTLTIQDSISADNYGNSAGFDFGYTGGYINAEVAGSSNTRVPTGVTASDDTTFFIVARVSKNNDKYSQSDVIVNPTTLTEPTTGWTTAIDTGTTLSTINRINSRTLWMDNDDEYYMDEIRVGTTYESVVPAYKLNGTVIFIQ